ncbi:RidA family protein [Pseudonocardia sp. DSM 110487]|jgi:reactive intermediate/imine deaminase|uniref:RidA family protein n=1 Tax=Pseudonocardia sp. DSM 110487 TaxID=2865833 RepID=UPI001C6971BB|nr:RidA family protein [Pseudonocardia sp. DSM 110487]QYN37266.1 RidA family protein [Pseudonocardia sp. DSM 110487]
MAKRAVSTTEAAPPGGPYSQAVVAGDHVYLAGAVPTTPDGTWVRGSFEEQARQVFTNLQKTAEAAGASLTDAVRVGVYLRDFGDFEAMNTLFAEFFGKENAPVRTTIPVALNGFDIEVDAILYTGS